MDDKQYIIDPLTSLCKLALLYFMPNGTKLAIRHHVLHIQDKNCYQWIERMKNGDKRIDISNLNNPIIKAIKWYILNNPSKLEMDDTINNNIRTISEFAILGLKKLQCNTYYNDSSIKIIIQYLINLLSDALVNTWDDKNCFFTDNSALSEKIKNNIDLMTIKSIASMLQDANTIKNDIDASSNIEAFVECCKKILQSRDNAFVNLMNEVNTTL